MSDPRFQHYWPDDDRLEERLERTYNAFAVPVELRKAAGSFLAILKNKNEATRFHYEHSIRVGLLGRHIGDFIHFGAKPLFFAGLLHDVGKALVPASTLGKTADWTTKDAQEIETHVLDGYRLLRDKFDFTAQILVWHHRFQKNCYPLELPPQLHNYSNATEVVIAMYGRLLAIADTFDALHRINSREGRNTILSGVEIRERMMAANADLHELVVALYHAKILPMLGADDLALAADPLMVACPTCGALEGVACIALHEGKPVPVALTGPVIHLDRKALARRRAVGMETR